MAAKEVKLNFKLMENSDEYEEGEESEEGEQGEEEESEVPAAEEEEIIDTDLHVEVNKEQSSPQNSNNDDNKVKPRFAISHKLSIYN
jgi:hypothetical protein